MSGSLYYLDIAGKNFEAEVTRSDGGYYGVTDANLATANLLAIANKVTGVAKDDTLRGVLAELREMRAALTPEPVQPPLDADQERLRVEAASRARAWAAYLRAGGSGDPGETFPPSPPAPGWAGVSLDELDLSARAHNSLIRDGIATIGELCAKRGRDLLGIKNFGATCLVDVREKLRARGLRLADDTADGVLHPLGGS